MVLYNTVCEGNKRHKYSTPFTRALRYEVDRSPSKHQIHVQYRVPWKCKAKRSSRVHLALVRITSSHALHLNCQVDSSEMVKREEDDTWCLGMTRPACHLKTVSRTLYDQHMHFCAS